MSKHYVDLAAAGSGLLSLASTVLPILTPILACIASVFTIAWYSLRFYEYKKSKRLPD